MEKNIILSLYFYDADGAEMELRIKDVRESITSLEIRSVADRLISRGIYIKGKKAVVYSRAEKLTAIKENM